MSRERLFLGASLVLNVVLFVLLFLAYRHNAQEQPSGEQIAAASPPPTSSPEASPTTAAELAPTDEAEATAVPASPTTPPEPTATATAVPTTPPEPTATPLPSPTPIPSPTPSPTPMPTPTNVPGPNWLRYTNLFRAQGGVPQVHENVAWSEGSRLHSIYMMNSNQTVHHEDVNSAWYTPNGNDAGVNGNIAASGWAEAPDNWPIDYWMSATFHVVPLLDPRLGEVGYGTYRDANSNLKMTGTMDVQRGLGELPGSVEYPLFFPKDGGQTWVLKYSLPEFPNPMTSCSGFSKPTGPPIVLQLGSGDVTPSVTSTSFQQGDMLLAHCVIDETRYVSDSAYFQRTGRLILDERDAIVILPGKPLEVGKTYTVTVEVNGATYTWSFETVAPPKDY